jgi:predicted DNA-binding WGR domain protein
MKTHYYEFIGGTSRKFWQYTQITTESASVGWGRIGQNIITQIVSIEEAEKRARQKLAKGYVKITNKKNRAKA